MYICIRENITLSDKFYSEQILQNIYLSFLATRLRKLTPAVAELCEVDADCAKVYVGVRFVCSNGAARCTVAMCMLRLHF